MKDEHKIMGFITVISVAVLAYELTQIRVFAYSLHPVIAYSAIALAMLGFGLGATLLAMGFFKNAADFAPRLARLSLGLALSMVAVNVLFAHTSTLTIPQGTLDVNPLWMSVVLLPCVVPYFLGGLITALIFEAGLARIGRLYFWNLLGSAGGSILMIVLLRPLGAERLILLASALAAAGGALAAPGHRRALRFGAIGVAAAGLALLPVAPRLFPFQPDLNGFNQLFEADEQAAGHRAPRNELTHWDPIGRIDVQLHTRDHLEVSEKIGFRVVTIDGGAMTLMLEEPGEPGTWGRSIFGESMYAAAYQLRERPKVLVIGSGGGSDIETALYWKASRVTGVEISGSTLAAVMGPYREFVGWPDRPEVEVVHGDGRSFAKSTDQRFDIVQLSGVDTMTMHTSGGAMVAAEDYLYTVDAFRDFLEILEPGGVLSVMRFGDQAMNLAVIASLALRELGIKPAGNIAALRQANMSGILVKRAPLTGEDIEKLRTFTSRREENRVEIPIYDAANVRLGAPVQLLHPQGGWNAPRYGQFFRELAAGNEEEALRQLGNHFVTPTDDKPYYILGTFFEAMRRGEKAHPALGLIIFSALIIGLSSLVLILLPVLFGRLRDRARPRQMLATVVYFFSIGAGFMLLEVGLIHKATVFVSTPGAAVAAVLSAIMVSSGVGARLTDIAPWSLQRKMITAVVALISLSIIYRLAVGPLFEAAYGLPVVARSIIAAATIAPAGVFMGWFFPVGLRVARGNSEALVPWAIAVNGFASVIGSLATLFLGLRIGLNGVFVVALVFYVIAVAAMLPLARRADPAAAGGTEG